MTDLDSNPTLALLARPSLRPADDHGGPRPDAGRDGQDPHSRGPRAGPRQARTLALHRLRGRGPRPRGDLIAKVFTEDHPDAKPERIELERRRLQHAPTVVAIVSRAAPHVKIPEWEQLLSAGASSMNLVIAANALGFVTAWLTEWYSYDGRVASALGLAASEKLAGFIHVGRPTVAVEDRVRPVLSDIVTVF